MRISDTRIAQPTSAIAEAGVRPWFGPSAMNWSARELRHLDLGWTAQAPQAWPRRTVFAVDQHTEDP